MMMPVPFEVLLLYLADSSSPAACHLLRPTGHHSCSFLSVFLIFFVWTDGLREGFDKCMMAMHDVNA